MHPRCVVSRGQGESVGQAAASSVRVSVSSLCIQIWGCCRESCLLASQGRPWSRTFAASAGLCESSGKHTRARRDKMPSSVEACGRQWEKPQARELTADPERGRCQGPERQKRVQLRPSQSSCPAPAAALCSRPTATADCKLRQRCLSPLSNLHAHTCTQLYMRYPFICPEACTGIRLISI